MGPGEHCFEEAKQVKSKNKKAAKISPYVVEFFKVFIEKKEEFVKPTGDAHYRPYNIRKNEHSDWPETLWTADTLMDLRLRVMDFRNLPSIMKKEESSTKMVYF